MGIIKDRYFFLCRTGKGNSVQTQVSHLSGTAFGENDFQRQGAIEPEGILVPSTAKKDPQAGSVCRTCWTDMKDELSPELGDPGKGGGVPDSYPAGRHSRTERKLEKNAKTRRTAR
jgi:hypothetical protein